MDAKIPVNNLLSTWGRQVGFFIAWVTAVWSGRGTGNTRGTSFPFPSRTESPSPPPPHHASFFFERLSQACLFKDKRQTGFRKHYQRTPMTTVKQKCEKKMMNWKKKHPASKIGRKLKIQRFRFCCKYTYSNSHLVKEISDPFGDHKDKHYRNTKADVSSRFHQNNSQTDCHSDNTTCKESEKRAKNRLAAYNKTRFLTCSQ